jgi:hypothetical protein
MESPAIPYDHANRLRAIVDRYFGFFENEAGFTQAKSHYDRRYLHGALLLRRSDVELEFGIHNDDLDLYVRPSGAQADFIKVSDLLFYFKRPKLDYAAARARPPAPEPSDDEIWRSEGAEVKHYLDRILEFAQANGYAQRVADVKRYQAEDVLELRRQIAEYEARSANK